MKWEIKYYLTEVAYKGNVPAFKETIQGDKHFVTSYAQNKIKHSNFKFYDIVQNK